MHQLENQRIRKDEHKCVPLRHRPPSPRGAHDEGYTFKGSLVAARGGQGFGKKMRARVLSQQGDANPYNPRRTECAPLRVQHWILEDVAYKATHIQYMIVWWLTD